jgi:HSP20 family molecular chaperone IbpA
VDPERVTAKLQNGVLVLSLVKVKPAAPVDVPVEGTPAPVDVPVA